MLHHHHRHKRHRLLSLDIERFHSDIYCRGPSQFPFWNLLLTQVASRCKKSSLPHSSGLGPLNHTLLASPLLRKNIIDFFNDGGESKNINFPAKICQGVSQFLSSTPSKVVSLLSCNIVIIGISPNTPTAPKFHNISSYCLRVTGLLCLGILSPCRTANSRWKHVFEMLFPLPLSLGGSCAIFN